MIGAIVFLSCNIFADNFEPKSWENAFEICKNNKLERKCLKWLLTYQCSNILGIQNSKECYNNSYTFTYLLNVKNTSGNLSNKEELVPVAFTSKVELLVKNQFVINYLTELNQKLEDGYRFKEKFNLWNFTLEKTKNNSKTAIMLIAILLQDTFSKAHLEVAQSKLLSDVLDKLDLANLNQYPNEYTWLELYPQMNDNILNQTLDRSLYHFYVPAYLASKNTQTNTLQAMLAFNFNAQYELSAFKGWPIQYPKNIDSKIHRSTLKQIYSGFQGAYFGMNLTISKISSIDFMNSVANQPKQSMVYYSKLLIKE